MGQANAINSLLRTILKAVELGDLRELEDRLEALELEVVPDGS